MSTRLVMAMLRDQVSQVTPTTDTARPFVPHVAEGGTMRLREEATAHPADLVRRFEVTLRDLPVDDGEAALTDRRVRATFLVTVAHALHETAAQEDLEVMLAEDADAITTRLWDPANWDAVDTGVMSLDVGPPRAVRLGQSDAVLLEIPVTCIYH